LVGLPAVPKENLNLKNIRTVWEHNVGTTRKLREKDVGGEKPDLSQDDVSQRACNGDKGFTTPFKRKTLGSLGGAQNWPRDATPSKTGNRGKRALKKNQHQIRRGSK